MSQILGKWIKDLTITTAKLAEAIIIPSKIDPNLTFTFNKVLINTDATVSANLAVDQTSFLTDASVSNNLWVDSTSYLNDANIYHLLVDGTTELGPLIVSEIQGILSTGDVSCSQDLYVSGVSYFSDSTISRDLRIDGTAYLNKLDLDALTINTLTVNHDLDCSSVVAHGDVAFYSHTQTRNIDPESPNSYFLGSVYPYDRIYGNTITASTVDTTDINVSNLADCGTVQTRNIYVVNSLYTGFQVDESGNTFINGSTNLCDLTSSGTLNVGERASFFSGLDAYGTSSLAKIKWGNNKVTFGEFEPLYLDAVAPGLDPINTATGFGSDTTTLSIGKLGTMGLIKGTVVVSYSGGNLYEVNLWLPDHVSISGGSVSPTVNIVNYPNDGITSYVIQPMASNVLKIRSLKSTALYQGVPQGYTQIPTGMKFYINNFFECSITA